MPIHLPKLFSKSAAPSDVIIVSGLPRSGTSMMMKMLEAGGLPVLTDHQRVADESNPKGYYEFERVKKLKEGDFDWLPQAQGKVVKVISALLEYLPGRYSYKIIFMRRDMEEILSSQRQMLLHDGKPSDDVADEKMASLYGAHLEKIKAWLAQQPNMATLWVSYNQTLKDPQTTITQLDTFFGHTLDTQAMLKVVDKNLYRERRSS